MSTGIPNPRTNNAIEEIPFDILVLNALTALSIFTIMNNKNIESKIRLKFISGDCTEISIRIKYIGQDERLKYNIEIKGFLKFFHLLVSLAK